MSAASHKALARALARLLNAYSADSHVGLSMRDFFATNGQALSEARAALIAAGYRVEQDPIFGQMLVENSDPARANAAGVAQADEASANAAQAAWCAESGKTRQAIIAALEGRA